MAASKKKPLLDKVDGMRRQAEELVKANNIAAEFKTMQEAQRLVHELEVHRIELEMQNDELRRSQEELELSRNIYAELYDFAPVGYFTFDTNGLILEVNLTGADMLGVEGGLLLNRSFKAFIADAADREIFAAHVAAVYQNQGAKSCVIKLDNNRGEKKYVNINSLIKERLHKELPYLCSTLNDITPLMLAEKIISSNEARYRTLVENAQIAIFINRNNKIIYANPATVDMFGLQNVEQILGLSPFELFSVDYHPLMSERINTILAGGTVPMIETNIILADGSSKTVEVVAAGFEDQSGPAIQVLLQDITVHKKIETVLQNAHDELETIVHQRTFELTRANMQLGEEVAERKRAEESLRQSYEEIRLLKEKLQAENIYLQQEVDGRFNFGEIVGQSPLLANIFLLVDQVASMNATVLLLGETGTGKGVIARAIHSRSDRKTRPLITVNCTTLPSSLIESELFGREKGAFTGSDARQIGRFELADGGTIFLDEIGELPLELQCKLLRVIQDGEFERLGSPRTIKCDVRIIAATNRNLKEEVKSGKFREDLYYRINVFPITMPALKQRKEDIPLLVKHFMTKFNKKIGRKIDTVSEETLKTLQEYNWPGNVRELESVIERAVITTQGSTLKVLDHFETHHKSEAAAAPEVKALGELEHDHISKVLQQTGWRIEGKSGAAVILGINASTLRARMRKLGIVRQ
jgi:PAS domain S-box-containing protein